MLLKPTSSRNGHLLELLRQAPRNLFFTGKGGVGKTTAASASALALADGGRRVLLVSTDPASNLDEVLGTPLGSVPTAVAGAPGLFALNVEPEEAARAYRESVVAPYRGLLPEAAVTSIEEQLSGACTVEIAAFDEFARLLARPEDTAAFDHLVFDTAPTGHTLRLLELPAAWSDFLVANAAGTSCLGPLAGLKAKQEMYGLTRQALNDPTRTSIVVVSRPEAGALEEAARAAGELAKLGVGNQQLLLNGLFVPQQDGDPLAAAYAKRGRRALATLPAALAALPRIEIPLSGQPLLGLDGLRRFGTPAAGGAVEPAATEVCPWPGLNDLIDELARSGRGVIMTMGKGGVGKTSLAAAIACGLAAGGYPVHLTTTDPAARVAGAVGAAPAGLSVSRIDPKAETLAYAAEVLATAGAGLDAEGRALLEEELRSPCTEEIAVFRAFARQVEAGETGFVVIDTAPTGHTLLLLDAAESYHREVQRNLSRAPEAVSRLLPRLRDPEFTRVLLVTLPEATPVHEAAALQVDLSRAGIETHGWIVNQSLTPHPVTDPVLAGRRRQEARYLSEVAERSERRYLIPWTDRPLARTD